MTVLLRSAGLELVRLTADEANDDRPVYVIREQGDTAETCSTYSEAYARERFARDCRVRALTGRAA